MTTWTVKPSGGDYTTLNAALSNASTVAGDIIEISGDWTSASDTTACTIADDNLTIRTAAGDQARHAGVDNGGTNYELAVTSGHCVTVSATGCVIDGLLIKLDNTGGSNECFRVNNGETITLKNCILYAPNATSQQDGLFCFEGCTIHLENTAIFGFGRAGCHVQPTSGTVTQTWNINSCSIWNCGTVETAANGGAGVSVRTSNASATANINIHNSLVIGSTKDVTEYNTTQMTPTWGISYSIDGDNSFAAYDTGGAGNLASRALRETTAGGNEVIVNDITSAPFDLRLVNDATNNDAQDAHTTATAEGLTIPGTDVAGTTRPQNTSHDIGFFEIVAGGGPAATSLVIPNRTLRNALRLR